MIPKEDARSMVRLVAEVAALRTDHATAKRYLMNGLKEMVGADCWIWTLGYLHPEKPPAYLCFLHDGFGEERFARFLQASEHPDMMALTAPFAREVLEGRHVTRLRQQIDRENRFPSSDVYPTWLEADVAPLMLSAVPLNDQCVSFIGIYRRADQPLFNERERQIAHILLTEVPWLHAEGWPEDFGRLAPSLSRKRRLVLNQLLEGDSRKIVAAKLGLSIHTVSDYIKDIYRTFGVRSHAELMRRFRHGD
jgi:DNA-binding CsgD family transcriptional regulator